jgi:hypothetical protein
MRADSKKSKQATDEREEANALFLGKSLGSAEARPPNAGEVVRVLDDVCAQLMVGRGVRLRRGGSDGLCREVMLDCDEDERRYADKRSQNLGNGRPLFE